MPLATAHQNLVLEYCDRHLGDQDWFSNEFSFIEDQPLRERLAQEFYAARYVYKLGEALSVTGDRLHAHVKFQIVQYASIYEAVIVHLLWQKFGSHPALAEIQYHESYKSAAEFPRNITVSNIDGEEIFLCVKRQEKTNPFSIKFNDKVDAAVAIGFVENGVGEEIKEFYRLRNAIHLETAIRKSITYELEQAQLAYMRMRPFIDHIKARLTALVPAPPAAASTPNALATPDVRGDQDVPAATLPEQP